MTSRVDQRIVRASQIGAEELAGALASSAVYRTILRKVLTAELESAILDSESKDVFSGVGVATELAYLAGQRNALRDAIRLL